MKLNIVPMAVLISLSLIACPLMYYFVGPMLDADQLSVLKTLGIICGCSALFCFVVGELSGNNSQMDKLWSLLPIVYTWVVAYHGGFKLRLVVMAVLATLWGARLTFNFARKGAYRLKFWEGKEDYRWSVLRARKDFQPHWKWVIFNFFFICIYQNLIVLLITFPSLVLMHSTAPFNWVDAVAIVVTLGSLIYETIADEQQWAFQTTKWSMIKAGKKLEELPEPYCKGFNTTGLWKWSRHPNYLGEQGTWVGFYIFTIAAGMGVFNWSVIGALLLIVLFLGSSAFAEDISASKYPLYADYCKTVSRYFPIKSSQL